MGKFLRLQNGQMRSYDEAGGGGAPIYDQGLDVVASSPGAGQVLGPITAGTSITLPSSQTYTSHELEVRLNGIRMETTQDYTLVGSPPRTQIQFTFDIPVGDRIRFRIDRAA